MKLSDTKLFSLIISTFFGVLIFTLTILILSLSGTYITTNTIIIHYIASIITIAIGYCFIRFYLRNFFLKKLKPTYYPFQPTNNRDETGSIKFNKDNNSKSNDTKAWELSTRKEIETLKKQAQYRREFVGNISHELKTPIFNIQGYVLTLLDGAMENPNITKKYLERTEVSINRLISIIGDLENISQLESGELVLKIETFDVLDLVREIIENMEISAQKRKITISIKKRHEKKLFVRADIHRIKQVYTNLIGNAIKYGKDGGHIEISFRDMNYHTLCEISDDGIGIPEKDQPRLFERFYRTEKARSRELGGSGLGLSIVKHIISAHDQSISVKSIVNIGTTFSFTLEKPLTPQEE